jgi:uncharacterized OB-fold protein
MSRKPTIIINDTSAPFWEGVKRHQLLLQYDPKADRYQFFPRPLSLYSNSSELEWRSSRGAGVLVAYTLTYFPAPGFEKETPYVEGIVQLDEGPRIFSPIAGAAYDALHVGQRMHVCWPDSTQLEAHPFWFEPT